MKHLRQLTSDVIRNILNQRTLAGIKQASYEARRVHDAPDTTFERSFLQQYDVGPGFNAPFRLRFPSDLSSTAILRQHDRADWQQTDSRIREFAAYLIEAFRRQGIPLYVHSAFRTAAEQAELVAKGVSKASYPYAPHCQGAAVDIVHSRFHWDMSRDEWQLIGAIGKRVAEQRKIPITWGGDWSFYDPAHWELKGWKDSDRIKYLTPQQPIRATPRKLLSEVKPVTGPPGT